jgi:hypothetical protein
LQERDLRRAGVGRRGGGARFCEGIAAIEKNVSRVVWLLKAGSAAPDIDGMSNTRIHRAKATNKNTRSANGRKKTGAKAPVAARLRTAVGAATFKEVGTRTGTHPENARRYLSDGLPGEGMRFLRAFCKTYNVSADWVLGTGQKA